MREKECERCKKSFSKMYRLRYIKSVKIWVFMCETCLLKVKKNNKYYQYGGTWKAWVSLNLELSNHIIRFYDN